MLFKEGRTGLKSYHDNNNVCSYLQMMEPFVPFYSKIPRRLTSVVVVLFMVSNFSAYLYPTILAVRIITTYEYDLQKLLPIFVDCLCSRCRVWCHHVQNNRRDSFLCIA